VAEVDLPPAALPPKRADNPPDPLIVHDAIVTRVTSLGLNPALPATYSTHLLPRMCDCREDVPMSVSDASFYWATVRSDIDRRVAIRPRPAANKAFEADLRQCTLTDL
jgi:hypothetical protein